MVPDHHLEVEEEVVVEEEVAAAVEEEMVQDMGKFFIFGNYYNMHITHILLSKWSLNMKRIIHNVRYVGQFYYNSTTAFYNCLLLCGYNNGHF